MWKHRPPDKAPRNRNLCVIDSLGQGTLYTLTHTHTHTHTHKQLKRNFQALEDVRYQVRKEDLQKFDSRLAGVKKEVITAIEAYGTVQLSTRPPTSHDLGELSCDNSDYLMQLHKHTGK